MMLIIIDLNEILGEDAIQLTLAMLIHFTKI